MEDLKDTERITDRDPDDENDAPRVTEAVPGEVEYICGTELLRQQAREDEQNAIARRENA